MDRTMQHQYDRPSLPGNDFVGQSSESCGTAGREMTMLDKVNSLMHRVSVLEKQIEDYNLQSARRHERMERIIGVGPKD